MSNLIQDYTKLNVDKSAEANLKRYENLTYFLNNGLLVFKNVYVDELARFKLQSSLLEDVKNKCKQTAEEVGSYYEDLGTDIWDTIEKIETILETGGALIDTAIKVAEGKSGNTHTNDGPTITPCDSVDVEASEASVEAGEEETPLTEEEIDQGADILGQFLTGCSDSWGLTSCEFDGVHLVIDNSAEEARAKAAEEARQEADNARSNANSARSDADAKANAAADAQAKADEAKANADRMLDNLEAKSHNPTETITQIIPADGKGGLITDLIDEGIVRNSDAFREAADKAGDRAGEARQEGIQAAIEVIQNGGTTDEALAAYNAKVDEEQTEKIDSWLTSSTVSSGISGEQQISDREAIIAAADAAAGARGAQEVADQAKTDSDLANTIANQMEEAATVAEQAAQNAEQEVEDSNCFTSPCDASCDQCDAPSCDSSCDSCSDCDCDCDSDGDCDYDDCDCVYDDCDYDDCDEITICDEIWVE